MAATLRRGSVAYIKDLYGDWKQCTVLNVSGSGEPSPDILVKIRMDVGYNQGLSQAGAIFEVSSKEVRPKTAIKFDNYGTVLSYYVCQETYPDRKKP